MGNGVNIQIMLETRVKLIKLRITERDTYDEIINRLIEENETTNSK